MKLSPYTVKRLYPLALAEGEGVGTAYEYYVKRQALAPFLAGRETIGDVLIAGLPEKYGVSLDFFLLAAEGGAALRVIDERPSALERAASFVERAIAAGLLPPLQPEFIAVDSLTTVDLPSADLILASEVLQRLTPAQRAAYVAHWRNRARALALFAPNGENTAHTAISGLNGLTLAEMGRLAGLDAIVDTIDLPPFPPGITRDEAQREQAQSGRLEAVAMAGLTFYARLERFVPQTFRRRHAHIVYALLAS